MKLLLLIGSSCAGMICFVILVKHGAISVVDDYGPLLAIVIGLGAAIGLLPIAYLFDKQEAAKKQRQSCPRCGQSLRSEEPSDKFPSTIEGRAWRLDREGQ